MINFKCHICGEKMEAPEALRGKTLECPNCGETVGVHGINSQLTPKSDTIHTDEPIYSSQNWFFSTVIIVTIITTVFIAINNSNKQTENQNEMVPASLNRTTSGNLNQSRSAQVTNTPATNNNLTNGPTRTAQEEIIGLWVAPPDLNSGEIAISKIGESYYFLRYRDNKLDFVNEIVEVQSLFTGRCFEDQVYLNWGIFYVINQNGNLEFWDNSGYISTAVSIDENSQNHL